MLEMHEEDENYLLYEEIAARLDSQDPSARPAPINQFYFFHDQRPIAVEAAMPANKAGTQYSITRAAHYLLGDVEVFSMCALDDDQVVDHKYCYFQQIARIARST